MEVYRVLQRRKNVSQVKKRGRKEKYRETTDEEIDRFNVYGRSNHQNSAKFYASASLPSSLCLARDIPKSLVTVFPKKKSNQEGGEKKEGGKNVQAT